MFTIIRGTFDVAVNLSATEIMIMIIHFELGIREKDILFDKYKKYISRFVWWTLDPLISLLFWIRMQIRDLMS